MVEVVVELLVLVEVPSSGSVVVGSGTHVDVVTMIGAGVSGGAALVGVAVVGVAVGGAAVPGPTVVECGAVVPAPAVGTTAPEPSVPGTALESGGAVISVAPVAPSPVVTAPRVSNGARVGSAPAAAVGASCARSGHSPNPAKTSTTRHDAAETSVARRRRRMRSTRRRTSASHAASDVSTCRYRSVEVLAERSWHVRVAHLVPSFDDSSL